MRFYIVGNEVGETVHCTTSLQAAHDWAAECIDTTGYSLLAVDVPVTAETVRLLLAGRGGYATQTRHLGDFTVRRV